MDLGPPIAYMGLDKGVDVLSSEGEVIGTVAHVLADEREDVFDGIVIIEHGQPHSHRFADADDVAEIHERGVLLKLDNAACRDLPEPTANPGVVRDDPGDPGSRGSHTKLRRAWDMISGNY